MGRCSGPLRPRLAGAFEEMRFGADWHGGAVEAYSGSKFVVAFENAQAPGYVTEKLALAFVAGAIPLYWGHADSAREIFNAEAYVDCSLSLRDCAARARELNLNRTEYLRVLAQPPLSPRGLAALRAQALPEQLRPLTMRLARQTLRTL